MSISLSSVALPVPRLSVTSQDKDKDWVKEDEEAEVNRGKSKPSTWFR